jgi:hypothetical protein
MINLSPSRLSSPGPLTRRRCHLSTDSTITGEVTLFTDAMYCTELTDTNVWRLYSSCTLFVLQMFNQPFVLSKFPKVGLYDLHSVCQLLYAWTNLYEICIYLWSISWEQPPIQWVPGALSLGVKRPGREADHSPPASVEVKRMWIYTSTPSYAFMA